MACSHGCVRPVGEDLNQTGSADPCAFQALDFAGTPMVGVECAADETLFLATFLGPFLIKEVLSQDIKYQDKPAVAFSV
jgi:hypothetical protein